jgi:hypothetical protein
MLTEITSSNFVMMNDNILLERVPQEVIDKYNPPKETEEKVGFVFNKAQLEQKEEYEYFYKLKDNDGTPFLSRIYVFPRSFVNRTRILGKDVYLAEKKSIVCFIDLT